MYLLDTCALSDYRRRVPGVQAWLDATDDRLLFISALTLGEITRGIVLIERRDARQAERLWRWLDEIRSGYQGRILAVDDAVAGTWGRLAAQRPRPVADALIAATALVHGKILVTRNGGDFADTGVEIANPWVG